MAYKIVGIGTIKIKMHDGIVRTLMEVRQGPELKKNLISTSALDTIGCKIVQQNGVLTVIRGALVVMKGNKVGNLYHLAGETVTGEQQKQKLEKIMGQAFETFGQAEAMLDLSQNGWKKDWVKAPDSSSTDSTTSNSRSVGGLSQTSHDCGAGTRVCALHPYCPSSHGMRKACHGCKRDATGSMEGT
jgi:hypothetical protein